MGVQYQLIEKIVKSHPFIYYLNDSAWCLSLNIQEVVTEDYIVDLAKQFYTFCIEKQDFKIIQDAGLFCCKIRALYGELKMKAKELENKKNGNSFVVSNSKDYYEFLKKLEVKDLSTINQTIRIINCINNYKCMCYCNEADSFLKEIDILINEYRNC